MRATYDKRTGLILVGDHVLDMEHRWCETHRSHDCLARLTPKQRRAA